MYEIENDNITRVNVTRELQTLVQIKVIDNKQMIVHPVAGTKLDETPQRSEVADYVREWFDLDNNLTTFYEIGKDDIKKNLARSCKIFLSLK